MNKERLAVLGLFAISTSLFGYAGYEIPRRLNEIKVERERSENMKKYLYSTNLDGYPYSSHLREAPEIYVSPAWGVYRDK